jgi:hypothetical protein
LEGENKWSGLFVYPDLKHAAGKVLSVRGLAATLSI